MNSINAAWNINTTRIYMQKIMSYQDYYDELLDLDCISYTDNNVECMVSIFSSGMNKYIPSLLENGVTDFVKKMFDGKLDLSNLEVTRINKKVIKLVKETGIPMELACQLVENHNVNAIMQFNKVLKFFKAETETCWQIIQDMGDNINLTQFGNYLIRSIFLTNNVKSTDLSGKFVSEYSILQFLHAYQDYLNLVHNDETADLFPEDVREAEKAVLDRLEYEEDMKKCEESSRIAGKFAEATKKYENLKYEDGVFTVEIPKLPHDLFKESMALHHCVKIYVQNVADGTSEICFVRKNGEPYMTVEIRNGKLIQAKKTCNLLPNEEDKDFLEKWCKEKEITIVNY
jgi:hypothetical protein